MVSCCECFYHCAAELAARCGDIYVMLKGNVNDVLTCLPRDLDLQLPVVMT